MKSNEINSELFRFAIQSQPGQGLYIDIEIIFAREFYRSKNPTDNMKYIIGIWEDAASHAMLVLAAGLQAAIVLRLAGYL